MSHSFFPLCSCRLLYRIPSRLYTKESMQRVRQVKIFGVTFTADTENLVQLNMTDLIKKVQILAQSWCSRSSTPLGKIVTINMPMQSIFVYKLMCIFTPNDKFFDTIRRILVDFLWKGKKKHHIKYKQLIAKRDEEGLQLVDLKI